MTTTTTTTTAFVASDWSIVFDQWDRLRWAFLERNEYVSDENVYLNHRHERMLVDKTKTMACVFVERVKQRKDFERRA
jgi:hypothetical protein